MLLVLSSVIRSGAGSVSVLSGSLFAVAGSLVAGFEAEGLFLDHCAPRLDHFWFLIVSRAFCMDHSLFWLDHCAPRLEQWAYGTCNLW